MKATQHLQISNEIIRNSVSSLETSYSCSERIFYSCDGSLDSGYEIIYSSNGKIISECQYKNGLKCGVEFVYGKKSFRCAKGFDAYYYYNVWHNGILISSKCFYQISRTEFEERALPKKLGAKYFINKAIERQLMMPIFQELNEGASISLDRFLEMNYQDITSLSFCLDYILDNKN